MAMGQQSGAEDRVVDSSHGWDVIQKAAMSDSHLDFPSCNHF